MSLNVRSCALLGSALLGTAMGLVVLGFALFLMPAETAISTPQPWVFALSTSFAVALHSAASKTQIKMA